jgi:hypothetical protein
MRRTTLAAGLLLVLPIVSSAIAQRVPPNRPVTLVVGRADSPSPAERVDGARRGFARTALPDGPLRVAWRRSAGTFIEHAPLVLPGGDIVVFSGRGDIVWLAPDGSEKRRTTLGAGPLGPGALLADGTIVTMTSSGEAVGIGMQSQNPEVRFRTRLGDRGAPVNIAPLALDDGGVVVANGVRSASSASLASPDPWQSEIAALDADGRVRARVGIPTTIAWPLIATRAGVAAIGIDGSVFAWSAGGTDAVRVGSFGGALDGGAAALDDAALVGVVDGKSVVSLDLDRGATRVLYAAGRAAVVFGPPSVAHGTTYVLEATHGGGRLVALDGHGGASFFVISGALPGLDADGGLSPSLAPIHTATLVDGAGRVAFAGPDGHVGIVSTSGTVDLGEPVCGRGAPPVGAASALGGSHAARPSAGFAGLTPIAPGAFLVACEGGAILDVRNSSGPPGP